MHPAPFACEEGIATLQVSYLGSHPLLRIPVSRHIVGKTPHTCMLQRLDTINPHKQAFRGHLKPIKINRYIGTRFPDTDSHVVKSILVSVG
jgi:hypothetical protein